ncbi:hypothetical protein B0H13DRAFT_2095829, partial [Mycena leptocephala]
LLSGSIPWIRLSFLSHFTTARRPQRWWIILNVRSMQYSQKNNTFNASPNVIPERKSFQTTPSSYPRCSRLISKIR